MSCKVEDCENTVHSRGMCNMHYLRQWRKGEITLLEKRQTYKAMHDYLARQISLDTNCMVCLDKAQERAWIPDLCDDPRVDESDNPKYKGLSFCTHLEHYAPMCFVHHRTMDNSNHDGHNGLAYLFDKTAVAEIPGEIVA